MKEKLHKIFSDHQGEVPEEVLLRYVIGEATPAEQRWIEERMADDPFLSDAVEGMMKAESPEKLKEELALLHRDITNKNYGKVRRLKPWKRWVQVAAALVILTGSIWIINNSIQQSAKKIFTEEFEPYPAPEREETPAPSATAPVTGEPAFIQPAEKSSTEQKETRTTEKVTVLQNENAVAEHPKNDETRAPYDKDEVTPSINPPEEDQSADFSATKIASRPYGYDSLQPTDNAPSFSGKSAAEPSSATSQSMSELATVTEKKSVSDGVKMKEEAYQQNVLLDDALNLYHSGNYQEAISGFELVLRQDANNEAANFYSGVSYLAVNNADAALAKLKNIDKKKESSYYEATLWYEALAYIQKNEKKNAISLLEKVVALNGEHHIKAAELLEQLK